MLKFIRLPFYHTKCIMYVQNAEAIGNAREMFCIRDIAPEGKDLAETNQNLEEMVELAAELQQQYDIKNLWMTCNLFSHPRLVGRLL